MNYLEFISFLKEAEEIKYYIIIIKEAINNKINNLAYINKIYNNENLAKKEIEKLKLNDNKKKKEIKSTNDNNLVKTYTIKQVSKETKVESFYELAKNDKNKATELFNKLAILLKTLK